MYKNKTTEGLPFLSRRYDSVFDTFDIFEMASSSLAKIFSNFVIRCFNLC